jgi:hypothetical protein
VVLVALDTNVVDLVDRACFSREDLDAMEAMEPPARFTEMPPAEEAEVFACYWLLALAPAWRSTVYTFSDALYGEVSRAAHANRLLQVAFDVLVREEQQPEHRHPDVRIRPSEGELRSFGVKQADAIHVADAVALRCHYLLTNDRQLRNRATDMEARWGLKIRRPSEFLEDAVRAGAPWTTTAPWPWESIERIRAAHDSRRILPAALD